MNFRNISAWSIRNPVVPLVLFIGLTLAGLVSFMNMKVQGDPDIEFPAAVVIIAQPGAAPTEIETQITQRVESAVRSIEGVQNISSTASEGSSTTFIEFRIGVNVDVAITEVKNAIDEVRGSLPDGILEPQVVKPQVTDPIAFFAVEADDMTIEQLSWFIDDTLAKQMLTIEGLSEVNRIGGVNREIRVIIDPAKMQALGVSANQLNGALRQVNLNTAGGKAEIAGSRQSVRVLGNAADAYALSQTQISIGGGRTVKLADVAQVYDGYGERTSIGKIRDREVVAFSIARAKGESNVSIYDAARLQLDKIEKESKGEIRFTRLFTDVDMTKNQYEVSMAAMVEGAVLAVIVVFFFLRDWRATFISALAIPLSAIPTFWFMDLLGFTLNMMSLMALGLVAGVLVDDAIVEIENIVRHMRMGKTAYQASIDAADEIGLAVVATTFSIVAVFLPVGLMPGIAGQFFKNFGLTVVAAVLMSLAVARMITPMVAAYFLKSKGHASHGEGPLMDRYMQILNWSLDTRKSKARRAALTGVRTRLSFMIIPALVAVAALVATIMSVTAAEGGMGMMGMIQVIMAPIGGFIVGLLIMLIVGGLLGLLGPLYNVSFFAWCRFIWKRLWARFFDHRFWMLGLGVGALALTGVMFAVIPSAFFPSSDSDFSQVRIEMVPGTTIEQTEIVSGQVAKVINDLPEVEAALERIGEGNARLFITYKKERDRTSVEIERAFTPVLQKIPDARVTVANLQGGGGGGNSPGRAITIMLSGSDPEKLEAAANTLVDQMKGVKEIVAPRVAADMRRPELIITPRTELAASLGVTTAALSQTIRIATLGEIDQNSAKFSLTDRQIPIRVMLAEESRRDLETIRKMPVATASGGSVPLERVADISFGSGPISIQRYNQNRRVFIGADLAPDVVKSQADAKIAELPILKNLPEGVANTPFGEAAWQAEFISALTVAILSAFLLVFAVLVLLYKRFLPPVVNMTSLLLAPLGGLLALWLFGQEQSMPVYIGILMLLGIVAKNSILLIDFALEEMDQGTPKYDAIMEAGHKRAQPIVMTTVAMVAGMVPTALSIGADGAWRAPMGTVVIGGLIVSTLLTLIIVPAGFSLADGVEKRIGPKLSRWFLTYKDGDDTAALAPLPGEPMPGGGKAQPAE